MKTTNKILEKDIQRQICDWLDNTGFFFWRNNNTPIFDPRFGGFRALPKYTPRGLPDIIILWQSKMIGIEVKRPERIGGTPETSTAQEAMKVKIVSNGGFYRICTSLMEAQDYVLGITRGLEI